MSRLDWIALAVVGVALAALPLVLSTQGQFWVRITNLAILYCFIFLYLAARGAGIWSVDASISGASCGLTVLLMKYTTSLRPTLPLTS